MPVLLAKVIDLQPGQEWYSDPFDTHPSKTLHLHAVGTQRFYVDIVRTGRFDTYRESGKAGPASSNPWPFPFGSDSERVDRHIPIEVGGPYRLVVRLGVFNADGRLRVTISED